MKLIKSILETIDTLFLKSFKGKKFPNMDLLENKYLVIPTHTKMSDKDAILVCKII